MSEAALRERVEYLEAENAELRQQLRQLPEEAFMVAAKTKLPIEPAQCRYLWLLWDGKARSVNSIMDALYGHLVAPPDDGLVRVHMHRLRHSLEHIGATVSTVRGFGYQLLAADRAKIAAHIGIEVQP